MEHETKIRADLAEVEARLSRLTQAVDRVTGERDLLVLKLTDLEGCHDQRFAGVRNQ